MKYKKPKLEEIALMNSDIFISCSNTGADDPDWDVDVEDDDPSYTNPEDDLW